MNHVVDILKITVALVLAAGLFTLTAPAAVHASGQLVTLVDRDSDVKTQVDDGKLRVGDGSGALTVNGTVGNSYRGRTPFTRRCVLETDSSSLAYCVFDAVPAGTILVITNISATVSVPSAQSVWHFSLDTTPGAAGSESGAIYLGFDQNTIHDSERTYKWDHHTEVAVLAGVAPRASVLRTASSGVLSGDVHIHGYLTRP